MKYFFFNRPAARQALLLTLLDLYSYATARLLLPTLAPWQTSRPAPPAAAAAGNAGPLCPERLRWLVSTRVPCAFTCAANRLRCPATTPCACRPGSLWLLVDADLIAPAHGLSLLCRLAKPFRVEEFARVRRVVRCSLFGRWPTHCVCLPRADVWHSACWLTLPASVPRTCCWGSGTHARPLPAVAEADSSRLLLPPSSAMAGDGEVPERLRTHPQPPLTTICLFRHGAHLPVERPAALTLTVAPPLSLTCALIWAHRPTRIRP